MALTKIDIAKASLKVLNRVGLDGLTVRVIADELGVKAPALYWHVKDKQELLDEVATQMYREHIRPLSPSGKDEHWTARLIERVKMARSMMLSYRDGARVFSGTFLTDQALPSVDLIEAIVAAGHSPAHAARIVQTVFAYTVGFTIEQQSIEPLPGKRDKRYNAAIERAKSRGSSFAAAIEDNFLGDLNQQFEEGLDVVCRGAEAWLGAQQRNRR